MSEEGYERFSEIKKAVVALKDRGFDPRQRRERIIDEFSNDDITVEPEPTKN